MTTSINSLDSGMLQQMMTQMYQKINSADADSVLGMVKNGLSTIAQDSVQGSEFLNSLKDQFNALDKDKNGELSVKEIIPENLQNMYIGMPPGLDLNMGNGENSLDLGNSLTKLKAFAGKLIDAYKNSDLGNLASSLNIAG